MAVGLKELILGGEGLIGREVTRQLIEVGHQVVSLDLKNGHDLRRIDHKPYVEADRVWFLAWDTGGAKYHSASEKQHQMFLNNSEMAARVFDALSVTRTPFMFVTSQLAGQPSAYGLTKLMAEGWATQLGGRIARLWNTYGWEDPDSRSHVITDLVISGLVSGAVRLMTTGQERRRFIYKTDCARMLRSFVDSDLMQVDIAGPEWMRIGDLAAEVANQLELPIVQGALLGEEVLIDPLNELPDRKYEVTLQAGVAMVIADARSYLKRRKE